MVLSTTLGNPAEDSIKLVLHRSSSVDNHWRSVFRFVIAIAKLQLFEGDYNTICLRDAHQLSLSVVFNSKFLDSLNL